MDIKNIFIGWGRALKLRKTSAEIVVKSQQRIAICQKCPKVKRSKMLKFFGNKAREVDTLYCGLCKCPITQKSLVETEFCQLHKW